MTANELQHRSIIVSENNANYKSIDNCCLSNDGDVDGDILEVLD